jgi:ribose transport system permease protein
MTPVDQIAGVPSSEPSQPAAGYDRSSGSLTAGGAMRWLTGELAKYRAVVLVYALLVGLVVYASLASDTFWTTGNLESLLQQSIPLGLAAIGELVVIIAGGIDMSIGMIARLSALLTAVYLQNGTTPLLVGLLIGVAVGIGAGLCNGAIITVSGANPFIVTLGTFGIIEGLCLAVTAGSTALMPTSYLNLYTATIHGFPTACVVMAGLWLVVALFLRSTQFGRHLYAVGGSAAVAQLAGIRVRRVRLGAYAISGLFGALAGLFLLAQSGVGNNTLGANLEFAAIVAVTLGGASLFGGRGTVVGTIGAVLLLTATLDVFQVLQIDSSYQNVFEGGVILCAIAFYSRDALGGGKAA